MHEQASRYFQSILPSRGAVRRFDVPASQAEIVIDLETWFPNHWASGRKFSIIGNVALYLQTDDADDSTTDEDAEVDLGASSPSAGDEQMGYLPANTYLYFEVRPGEWGGRTAVEQYLHVRGASAGAVWIAVASHETA